MTHLEGGKYDSTSKHAKHTILIEPSRAQKNPRTIPILAVAKANGLDVELVETEPNQGADYLKINALGKIPTFIGANGFNLNEAIAIAVYGMFHDKSWFFLNPRRDLDLLFPLFSFSNDETRYQHSVIPGRIILLTIIQL
jgi:hypothetical protein